MSFQYDVIMANDAVIISVSLDPISSLFIAGRVCGGCQQGGGTGGGGRRSSQIAV